MHHDDIEQNNFLMIDMELDLEILLLEAHKKLL